MKRYSVITNKNPREIVLLRGTGCVYKRCAFCDYYTDCGSEQENFMINREVLQRVEGVYGDLEVINSGSVFELDAQTLAEIKRVCAEKRIHTLHFESHYLYRDRIPDLRAQFKPITLRMKLGLETFDKNLRETVLRKGIRETDPEAIARNFDEANFLFGITGQTVQSMRDDIRMGLTHFKRICVNIMCENSTAIRPDKTVIAQFLQELYPELKDNPRVDVLIENTDFGVGA